MYKFAGLSNTHRETQREERERWIFPKSWNKDCAREGKASTKVGTNLIQTTLERFVFSSNLVKILCDYTPCDYNPQNQTLPELLTTWLPAKPRTQGHVYNLETLVLKHVANKYAKRSYVSNKKKHTHAEQH